jgi:dTDP-4-amino-4,6-dideoxygalactose transaminase
MKIIPYGRQYIDNKDIKFVSKSLKNNLITTGDYVKRFESQISKLVKSKFSISCSNGTAGLHLAFKAINIKKDDIIVMPAINFIAVYSMAKLMNAKIFLADVDPFTGQMTPKTLLECIKNNKLKKIKAIVTMYLGGYPENIVEFHNIKKMFSCYLIEDACHALGAKYFYNKKSLFIGSCKHSDISVFSLHPVKTITSGEGGVVTTNNKFFYDRMISLRSHGICRNKNLHWDYNIRELGYNYRLSDINCALGLSQLKRINKFIKFRKKIYTYYKIKLSKYKDLITLNNYNKNNKPSYHLFLISINFKKINSTKDKIIKFLKKNRIIAQYHYIPLYKFEVFGKTKISYPNSEFYFSRTVSLPIFFNYTRKQHDYVLSKIKNFFIKISNVNT